ncbi:hypothetical protein bthur0010_48080 [Bacillus thuringiensis serovar pondicheriensis BGSC 4BA1]|nr:hypothetical protein bthur0010_48080 [Bacillus thuringiensis serovar pondicheriensis BGSC 4BA1]
MNKIGEIESNEENNLLAIQVAVLVINTMVNELLFVKK